MILVRNIRLPLSAGEPQAFEKALHAARIPRGKVQHLGVAKLSVYTSLGWPWRASTESLAMPRWLTLLRGIRARWRAFS